MRLLVHAIEARSLPAMDANGLSDPYAKLQLGRRRAKTKVVRKSLSPAWDEEFAFPVGDLKDELVVCVLDEDKYFSDDFLGQVKVPLSAVLDAENRSLGTQWYQLQPKSKKSKIKDCGEICLTISLSQNYPEETMTVAHCASDDLASNSDKSTELKKGSLPNIPIELSTSVSGSDEIETTEDKSNGGPSFVNRLYQIFSVKSKDAEASAPPLSKHDRSLDILEETLSTSSQLPDKQDCETSVNMSFDELLKAFETRHEGDEMPENLSGGVLLEQVYAVAPSDLNSLLFSPSSDFLQSLAEMQGTTGMEIQQWRQENDGEIWKRVVSYTKAPTKLVKAVKATEDTAYLKADGEMYAVLADVSTHVVPFWQFGANCSKYRLQTVPMRVRQGLIAPDRGQLLHLRVLMQQKHGGDCVQVRLDRDVLLIPWDPGGNGDYFFASAWGQASFQGGRNVTNRPGLGLGLRRGLWA